jgi:hypothetical protein
VDIFKFSILFLFLYVVFFKHTIAQSPELWTRLSLNKEDLLKKSDWDFEILFREQYLTRYTENDQHLFAFRIWVQNKIIKNSKFSYQVSPFAYFHRIIEVKSQRSFINEYRATALILRDFLDNKLNIRTGLEYRVFENDDVFSEVRNRTRVQYIQGINKKIKLILFLESFHRYAFNEKKILFDQLRLGLSPRISICKILLEPGYQAHYRNSKSGKTFVNIININLKYSL